MVSLAQNLAKRLPFYYGWIIMGVVGLASFSSVSFSPGVIGGLVTPMAEEFGWSRATFSGAVMAGSVMVVVTGPVSGRLLDRYGPRPVASAGTLLMTVCLVGLGYTNSTLTFYLFFGLGFAMFNSISRVALSSTTAQWFVRRRGFAAAVVGMSTGLGFVVLPLVATLIMGEWGWRAAWVSMGVVTFLLAVPTSYLLLLANPSQVGQRVDGDRSEAEATRLSGMGRSAAQEEQWTVGEAIKTPTPWLMLLGLSIQGIALNGANIHLIPRLLDQGISANVAILSFTIGGATVAISGFFWGPLSDRIHIRYVYALSSLVLIGFVLAILLANAGWMVILIGLTMGIGFGGNVMVMRVGYPNFFGRRSAGAIQGFVMPFQLLVAGTGALIAGALFDLTGSYVAPFSLFMGMMGVAILIVLLVPNPVKRTHSAETVQAS